MKKLFIDEFIDVTSYGASCPIIVKASDNNTYVLKTRYQSNLSIDDDDTSEKLKDASIYIETLSYLLLQNIGFENIPEIVYLDIDQDALDDASMRFNSVSDTREKMALQNILNSTGLNLGVKWIEDSEGAFSKFDTIPKQVYETAINYDSYIFNADRDISNPNVLFSKKNNRFYLIDFGNAFDCLTVFEDIYENGDLNFIELCDKYVFDSYYLFLNKIAKATKYKKTFSKNELMEILQHLPSDWKPSMINSNIAELLSRRIGNKEIFEDA